MSIIAKWSQFTLKILCLFLQKHRKVIVDSQHCDNEGMPDILWFFNKNSRGKIFVAFTNIVSFNYSLIWSSFFFNKVKWTETIDREKLNVPSKLSYNYHFKSMLISSLNNVQSVYCKKIDSRYNKRNLRADLWQVVNWGLEVS